MISVVKRGLYGNNVPNRNGRIYPEKIWDSSVPFPTPEKYRFWDSSVPFLTPEKYRFKKTWFSGYVLMVFHNDFGDHPDGEWRKANKDQVKEYELDMDELRRNRIQLEEIRENFPEALI